MKKLFSKLRPNFSRSKEVMAVTISIVSFVVSLTSTYFNSLKNPDISIASAPYIKHIVDDQSLNEAFFIPITVINRGARPGTVLSLELEVTNPDGDSQVYYAQYFLARFSQSNLGDFFSPMTLYGHSSEAKSVAFYPLAVREGKLLSDVGEYQFVVTGEVANVRNENLETAVDIFSVKVDAEMAGLMRDQFDGEYPYLLPIESENIK